MVFLRLEVRVFPREQAPNTGFFKSVLGRPESDDDNVPKKTYAGFLLTLEKPEDYTMGDLAYLIKEKWKALRPDAEQIVIKKLLDDTMPSIDLEVGMSVADVFVDRGKALADGHDQRGIVRVIQKPDSSHAPVRFPSVVQDFEGASEAYARKKSVKTLGQAFSPIPEDPHDTPISSVEIPHGSSHDVSPTFSNGKTQPANSPSPRELRSRKRKQSTQERDTPAKEPRVEAQPQDTSSPERRKSKRISSFASPNRRLSYSQPTENGLGLGITGSPKAKRNAPSHSSPPLPSVPHSILSKSSKNTPSNARRRISFVESSTPTTNAHSNKKPSPSHASNPRPSQKASMPASSQSMAPPSSQASTIVYPPGSEAKRKRMYEESVERERTKNEAIQTLDDPNADSDLRSMAGEISNLLDMNRRKTNTDRRKKLELLLKKFKQTKDRLATTVLPKTVGSGKEPHDDEKESDGSEGSNEESEEEGVKERESGEEGSESESEEENEDIEGGMKSKFFDLEADESASSKDDAGVKGADAAITITDNSDSNDEEMADLDPHSAIEQDDQVSESEKNEDIGSEDDNDPSYVSSSNDSGDEETGDLPHAAANGLLNDQDLLVEENDDAGSEDGDENETSNISANLDTDHEMTDLPPAPAKGPSDSQVSDSEQNDNAGPSDINEPTQVPKATMSVDQGEENFDTQEDVGNSETTPSTGSDSGEDSEEIAPEKETETSRNQQEDQDQTHEDLHRETQQENGQKDQRSSDSPSPNHSSNEDSDSDSEYDPNLTFPPLPGNGPAKAQPAAVTQDTSAEKPRRKTLSTLLESRRAERAARDNSGQMPTAKPAAPPTQARRGIFDESEDSESDQESESDEDTGDILPNGTSGLLAKPRRVAH